MPADSNICKLKSHWPNFSMVVDGGFNYQAHSKIRKLDQEIRSIILMSFKLDGQHLKFLIIQKRATEKVLSFVCNNFSDHLAQKKSSRDRVVLGQTTTANCDSKVFVGTGQKISEGNCGVF